MHAAASPKGVCAQVLDVLERVQEGSTAESGQAWPDVASAVGTCLAETGGDTAAVEAWWAKTKDSPWSSLLVGELARNGWLPPETSALPWASRALNLGQYDAGEWFLSSVAAGRRSAEWYYTAGRIAFRQERAGDAMVLFGRGGGLVGNWERRNRYQEARVSAWFLGDLKKAKELYQGLAEDGAKEYASGARLNLLRIALIENDPDSIRILEDALWEQRKALQKVSLEEIGHLAQADPRLRADWKGYAPARMPAPRGLTALPKLPEPAPALQCLVELEAWDDLIRTLGEGVLKLDRRQDAWERLRCGRATGDAALRCLAAERLGHWSNDRYPDAHRSEVLAASRAEGVPPQLVWAILREESRFRPDVMSPAGALGMAQFMPETAQRLATASERDEWQLPGALLDPGPSIRLCARYLGELWRHFQGRVEAVIAAYNSGAWTVDGWVAAFPADVEGFWHWIPYDQTRDYVAKVHASYQAYLVAYPELRRREPAKGN